ncbi:platelet glycoprotein VI isoform X3 [Tupaia chinensis]|nr:platelet glycoprotein VI isoform X3 [Tupaia chinensis]
MKAEFAGRYRCFYQMGAGWSPASEQLELVATGAFDKPSLSARPSTEVSPGGRVTLQCRATYGFDRFALYKEGDPRTSQRPGKWYEADFSLGAVTPAVGGTYRCYSFSSKSPYLWSAPSDPLELTVTGFPEASGKVTASPLGAVSALASSPESSRNITVPPRAPHAPIVPARQYYTQGNLVRICLGAVILVVLVGLLAEDWHSRKKRPLRRVRAEQRPLPPLPQARKSHGCEDGGRPDVCSPRACH